MRGILATFVFLLLVPLVSAAYISLQTSVDVNETVALINVTHLGDEPAYQVQVISEFLGQTYKSEVKDKLNVGDVFTTSFPIDFTGQPEGTYPLLTTVHYQDANDYLFSALLSRIVKNGLPSRSELSAELSDAEIKDSVRVKVGVKNLGDEEKSASVFLFMSEEFKVKDNRKAVTLAPKSAQDVVFEVENFGARAGSTYSFYAIVEYDDATGHYGALDSGAVKVLEKKFAFLDTRVIVIALVAIVLIFVVLQFRKKRR
jgi:hypothetical protein